MKKIFFTFFILTISYQNYSQTSQSHLHNLRDQFWSLAYESGGVKARMINLAEYSAWNSGEHSNMGQANLANNWNSIREAFLNIETHFSFLQTRFHDSENTFNQLGSLLGNFDGSYSSLSGLPSLFDGSFSSLSGTPTTLAGYGITDAFDGSYASLSGLPSLVVESITEGGNTGIRLSSANAANHGDIGNTAVDLSYQSSADYDYGDGATGDYSTALGYDTTASGPYSTVTGSMTEASGTQSTAMGYQTKASGNHSTAMGRETKANGFSSTALGFYTTADDFSSLAIGQYNKTDETPNPNNFSYQNTAFVIGNGGYNSDGAYDGHLSNAFEILFDGTTTIAGDLSINSDARLKANIVSLGATLTKLLQIEKRR